MAGGQGDRFIEEEQPGIGAGTHHVLSAALELEPADDPMGMPPAGGAEPAIGIVQDAAVAHEQAARLAADDLAERRHPVLERHSGRPSGCGLGMCHALLLAMAARLIQIDRMSICKGR